MSIPFRDEDSWTPFEKLLLVQLAYKHQDNWQLVNCSSKYRALIEPYEREEFENENKKKLGDISASLNDEHRMPPAAKLARKLYQDRILELRSQVSLTEQRLRSIFTEIEDIKAGKYDDKLAEILKDDEQKKQDFSKIERLSERQDEENPEFEIVEEEVVASSADGTSTQPIIIDNDNDEAMIKEVPDVSEVNSDKRTKNINEEKKIGMSFTDKKLEINNESDKFPNVNDRENVQVLGTGTMEQTNSTVFVPTEETEIEQKSKSLTSLTSLHATESFATIRTPSSPFTELNELKYDEKIEQSSEVQMNIETLKEDIPDDLFKSTDGDVEMMEVDVKINENIEEPIPSQLQVSTVDLPKHEQIKRLTKENVSPIDSEATPREDTNMEVDETTIEISNFQDSTENLQHDRLSSSYVSSPAPIIEERESEKGENFEPTGADGGESEEVIGSPDEQNESDNDKSSIMEIEMQEHRANLTLDTIKSEGSSDTTEPAGSFCEEEVVEVGTGNAKMEISEVKHETVDDDNMQIVDSQSLNEENEEMTSTTSQAELKEQLTPTATTSTHHMDTITNPSPGDGNYVHESETISGADASENDKKQKTWLKLATMMLHEIGNHKFASVFQNPIKEQDAPGYYSIVKQPMDLKTLKKRLRDGAIQDTDNFHRDLLLMFMNASVFNREGDINKMASQMKEHAEVLIQGFRSEGSVGIHEPATRRKSMAFEAKEAIIIPKDDRRNSTDKSGIGSSRHGTTSQSPIETSEQRPSKRKRRLTMSQK
ncbi:Bromodomain-containing protein [Gigaspora margarita]|uniref:Bromodomain-containing protein n=1 Tax=Gigaspora margarita TaxID=4874 RepID=A0A8H3XBK6_GIGMA|nr:Bromodomain-containing protein [Gigaspora margarita]